MNVASLEICKELHEVSGWGDPQVYSWRLHLPTGASACVLSVVQVQEDFRHRNSREAHRFRIENKFYPAYDFGYVFGKLIGAGTFGVRYISPENPLSMDLEEWYGKCIAYTPDMKQGDYPVASSPVEALIKLAIKLFKQGILHKESNTHE